MSKNIDTNSLISFGQVLAALDRGFNVDSVDSIALRELWSSVLGRSGLSPDDVLLGTEDIGAGSVHKRACLYVRVAGEVKPAQAYMDSLPELGAQGTTWEEKIAARPKNMEDWAKRIDAQAEESFSSAANATKHR